MGKNDNWDFIDIISILSFIIGLQNLESNQKQISDLDKHLSEQDNKLLTQIIHQNKEIIQLLKENK